MLKLVIADDEQIIRKTMVRIIDWTSIGITVAAVCQNGIEAYNAVLDESPDIVITDIRMPGMSGLGLIQKIREADSQVQFIILSGYGEFEYAQEAMQYGVRYYLLKPANEKQVIECAKRATADCIRIKEEASRRERHSLLEKKVHNEIIYHSLIAGLAKGRDEDAGMQEAIRQGLESRDTQYFHDSTEYYIHYIYYLDGEWEEVVKKIIKMPCVPAGIIYVKHTLILVEDEKTDTKTIADTVYELCRRAEIRKERYESFSRLLSVVAKKIVRYDTIYIFNGQQMELVPNDQHAMEILEDIIHIPEMQRDRQLAALEETAATVLVADRKETLRLIARELFSLLPMLAICSNQEAGNRLQNLYSMGILEMKETVNATVASIRESLESEKEISVSGQICNYIDTHLENTNLSLKYIANNVLFMNADYAGRKFREEKGIRFSQYLTDQRIEKVKKMLSEDTERNIQYIAEQVGWGDDPKYLQQVFKKATGMTMKRWSEREKGKPGG